MRVNERFIYLFNINKTDKKHHFQPNESWKANTAKTTLIIFKYFTFNKIWPTWQGFYMYLVKVYEMFQGNFLLTSQDPKYLFLAM